VKCRCGFDKEQHFTAITTIEESPFNRTRTKFVLVCPPSTFHEATEKPEPVKPVKASKTPALAAKD
jgi:hypothetical protein